MGEKVYYRNFNNEPQWVAGVITKLCGPVSLLIKSSDGQLIRRHVDHTRKRIENKQPLQAQASTGGPPVKEQPVSTDPQNRSHSPIPLRTHSPTSSHTHSTRPSRASRPPDRFAPLIH